MIPVINLSRLCIGAFE
jgi:hypothetical protein